MLVFYSRDWQSLSTNALPWMNSTWQFPHPGRRGPFPPRSGGEAWWGVRDASPPGCSTPSATVTSGLVHRKYQHHARNFAFWRVAGFLVIFSCAATLHAIMFLCVFFCPIRPTYELTSPHTDSQTKSNYFNINGFNVAKSAAQLLYGPVLVSILLFKQQGTWAITACVGGGWVLCW